MRAGLERAAPRTAVALPVPQPLFDESISSYLDRAASVHGVDRYVLGRDLLAQAYPGIPLPCVEDWDQPPPRALQALAQASGLSAKALLKDHGITDGPGWLLPQARTAWCPQCFARDASWQPPYFRREWARAACTFCPEDGEPLLDWPPEGRIEKGKRQGRRLPLELLVNKRVVGVTMKSGSVWRLRSTQPERQRYAKRLRAITCLPQLANSFMTRELKQWERDVDYAVENSMNGPSVQDPHNPLLSGFVSGLHAPYDDLPTAATSGVLVPNGKSWTWYPQSGERSYWLTTLWRTVFEQLDREDYFRSVANPAARRAALWLAACVSLPRTDLDRLCEDRTPVFLLLPYLRK
ncbi:MAG: TniQ family protein [Terriglobia bacterium]